MDFAVLGWPPDGPTLELDWRAFSYAGKFVMTTTGKAVLRRDGTIVGAAAFNEDRTDATLAWIRYITVREEDRGNGFGPVLAASTVSALREEGYESVHIAVNNPYAYEAMYKAGFGYTGEETGVAELILETPSTRPPDRYIDGLERYLDRDLSPAESEFVVRKLEAGDPPERVKGIR